MSTTTAPVPRWAVVAAHLVPLATLPSSLWRIPVAFGFTMGMVDEGDFADVGVGESLYVLSLSVILESLALLTLGLVRPWGERAPRWIPLIGGRDVPVKPVVWTAGLGALALAAIWAYAFRDFLSLPDVEFTHDAWHVLLVACYAPLLLWAPLLAAVTWDYWRRRVRGR
jgi:hypothetical protein